MPKSLFAHGSHIVYAFISSFLKVLSGFIHQFSMGQHKVCVILIGDDFYDDLFLIE
jgi:hypothetical protein